MVTATRSKISSRRWLVGDHWRRGSYCMYDNTKRGVEILLNSGKETNIRRGFVIPSEFPTIHNYKETCPPLRLVMHVMVPASQPATKIMNGAFSAFPTRTLGSRLLARRIPTAFFRTSTNPLTLSPRFLHDERPHLSYFLPRMVLDPSALSAPFTLTDSIPPSQQRRHPTAATLARQVTILIPQLWAQHNPDTDPSFGRPSVYRSRSMAAHSVPYRVTYSSPKVSCRPGIRKDWLRHLSSPNGLIGNSPNFPTASALHVHRSTRII